MRIYIAGPISKGDQFRNVGRAVEAFVALLEAGHAPHLPHFCAFTQIHFPQPYERRMKLDMIWLAQCEGLLRLEGESDGADREVARAKELGLSIWYEDEDVPALEEFPAENRDGPPVTAGMVASLSVEMVRLKESILEVARSSLARARQLEDLAGRVMSLEAPGDAIKAKRLADEVAKLEGYSGDNA